jgi:hypothetical protein
LAYRGLENRVLFAREHVFVTTEFTVAEMFRILTKKRGLDGSEALELVGSMPVLVVSRDFRDKLDEADGLIGKRDKSDVPWSRPPSRQVFLADARKRR